jgi:hypothetical protein
MRLGYGTPCKMFSSNEAVGIVAVIYCWIIWDDDRSYVKGKDWRGNGRGLLNFTVLSFTWRHWEKPQNISDKILGMSVEIRTKHLSNTTQKTYSLSQFGEVTCACIKPQFLMAVLHSTNFSSEIVKKALRLQNRQGRRLMFGDFEVVKLCPKRAALPLSIKPRCKQQERV